MKYQDYYAVLGVPRDASQDDIKKAFRRQSKKYHPDVNKDKDAEEKFKTMGEAYEVLKDPERRRKYDQLGSGFRPGDDFRPPPGYGGFGGGGGQGPWQNVEWNVGGTQPGDVPSGFSDFFDAFFGGGGQAGGRRRPRGGRDPYAEEELGRARGGEAKEVELQIALEDAYQGATKTITLTQSVVAADGGRRSEEKTYTVKIPPGTTDGTRIRLAGQGGKGRNGGVDGDLYLKVKLAPHARFVVDGHDLDAVLPLAPWEAALGAKVDFATLDGTVRLTVPPGSSSGQKLRLKNKGLPQKGGERGNLEVELRVVVPATLSDRERALFEELQKVSAFKPR
jgi:curved DNA-binding protein